jgi:glycosyltransferase involved in cell wall biosynthesis
MISAHSALANARKTSPTVWHIGADDVRMRIPLLLELRNRGFYMGAVGSEEGHAFLQHDIPYWRYSLDRWINPWADLRAGTQLYQLFRKYKPDIVHGFDTKPGILAPIAARQAGIPGRVCTYTGMGYVFSSRSPLAYALRPLLLFLQRRAFNATHLTVFQNPDDRDYLLSHRTVRPGKEALILGSGIDIERLLAACPNTETRSRLKQELGLEGQRVVTMIARLVVQKGVREYLEAARRIQPQVRDVTFLLVGPIASEGAQAISVKEVERSANSVRYLGPRSDIPAILALTDLFVLPSYYREGIPLITTDMPGCKEVVRTGWNGLLVPPRDVKALVSAMLRLLSSNNERTLMGKRSKAHVRNRFSLPRVADAYAAIYQRVLDDNPGKIYLL